MKYEVLKGCVINSQGRQKGEILEISDDDAKMLLGLGRIAPVNEQVIVENRSVGLDEESKPRRRGRKSKADL